jgi:hypothetical protein
MCCVESYTILACLLVGLKSFMISWTTGIICALVQKFDCVGDCFCTCALIIWRFRDTFNEILLFLIWFIFFVFFKYLLCSVCCVFCVPPLVACFWLACYMLFTRTQPWLIFILTCHLGLLSYMLVFIAVSCFEISFYHTMLRVCFSFVLSVDWLCFFSVVVSWIRLYFRTSA